MRNNSLANFQQEIDREIRNGYLNKKKNGNKNRDMREERISTENNPNQSNCINLKNCSKRDHKIVRSCSNRRNYGSITKFTPVNTYRNIHSKSGHSENNNVSKKVSSPHFQNSQQNSSERKRKVGQITKTVSHWSYGEGKMEVEKNKSEYQKKFIKALCKQIKLDENLVSVKNMVQKIPEKNRREVKKYLFECKKDLTKE